MFETISILGSTGSIGTQTLDVCRTFGIQVSALAAGSNIELLEKQVREFKPAVVSVINEESAARLKDRLADMDTKVLYGEEGVNQAASQREAECVVSAIVGIAGLKPTMRAIEENKHIALANKETLVTAGDIVIREMKKRNLMLLPVDSEHSAIFQCMYGNQAASIKKIILTASGGPFRGRTKEALEEITPEQALKHPNWDMGSKVTIDSATLMNKGLEVIEASHIFGLPGDNIEVVVHPQSMIHSMVEFVDGSVIAQLGLPDMKLPIQVALTYPQRIKGDVTPPDFAKIGSITFEPPDTDTFLCLKLAYRALKCGGTLPVVLNAANEIAVALFLKNKISFPEIPGLVENEMNSHIVNNNPTLDDILLCDRMTRSTLLELYGGA